LESVPPLLTGFYGLHRKRLGEKEHQLPNRENGNVKNLSKNVKSSPVS